MQIQLAGCVIVDDYGRILLLHRSRGNRTQWELPGGKIEPHETAEEAAVRELLEELGIDVRLTSALGSGEFESGENSHVYTWFQAVIVAGQPELMEPEGFDDFDYFDLDDMLSLALSDNMHVLLPQIASGEIALE